MSQVILSAMPTAIANAQIYADTRRIYNPVQKDTVTFLQTSEESGGTYTLFEMEVAPGGGNTLHYHTTFDERFTVISGECGVQLGNEQFTLTPGQSAIAPMKVLHRWYNTSNEPVMVRVELLPGSTNFEQLLRITYGLARDGLVNAQGLPKNIVHLAILSEMADTIVPGFFANILPVLRMIARYARRKGIERELIERYCH